MVCVQGIEAVYSALGDNLVENYAWIADQLHRGE